MSAKPTPPSRLPDPNNLREVLAYWIRLKRVDKGWSQERLAMECELDRTYVSAVERSRWTSAPWAALLMSFSREDDTVLMVPTIPCRLEAA